MGRYTYITLPKHSKTPTSEEALKRLPLSILRRWESGFINQGYSEIHNDIEKIKQHYSVIVYELVEDTQDPIGFSIASVMFHSEKEYINLTPADNQSELINLHKKLISLYHRVENAKNNFNPTNHNKPIVMGDTALSCTIEEFISEIAAIQHSSPHFLEIYPSLIKALELVSDVLGLNEDGMTSFQPRISVAEYNQAVHNLTLQSTKSLLLASLGYVMLSIALLASPYLAISGALTVPAAILFAQGSALASWGMFSNANEDPGRRCLHTMQDMVNTKLADRENALQQLFHVETEEASCLRRISDFCTGRV